MSTFTQELLLENPTPFDPATEDTWGSTENEGRTLVDSAIAGILSLPVPGSSDVILTSVQGAPDQARNAHFEFTDLLTGNIAVLWPNGRNRMFSVFNGTTGAFTLTIGVDDGGGSPAGTTVTIPQGYSVELVSDGTNITERGNALASGPIGVFPVGAVIDYAPSTQPAGWLFCNNQAVSRTGFAALFAAIGTTYGVGDGSTTFNVPDLRGRSTSGVDNMGGVTAANRVTNAVSGITGTTLGGSGGSQSLQQHSHSVSDPTHAHGVSDPGHQHVISAGQVLVGGGGLQIPSGGPVLFTTVATDAAGTGIGIQNAGTGISIQNTGAGAAQNMPPTMMLNKIIKT